MIRALILSAALVAALAPASLDAQSDPNAPHMQDVMSPGELRETGIASLAPAQRAALDAWLARYTGIVERAASQGAQATASEASAPSSNDVPAANEMYSGPLAVPYGSRIAEVRDGGAYIVLSDGTVWEVYLPNRPATTTWGKGDYLIVAGRLPVANGEFGYQLTNGRDGNSAAVKWRGKAAVTSH